MKSFMLLPGSVFRCKMFIPFLENAFGRQMYFVSIIFRFYLAWPFIVKLMNYK